MFLLLPMSEGVHVAVLISRRDGHMALPGELHHLLVVAVALHAELLSHPAHLLRDLLLHEVHAHRDQGHPKDTVDHSEAHLHEGHRVMLEPLESLAWGVVPEADGGEGDETEVRGLYG